MFRQRDFDIVSGISVVTRGIALVLFLTSCSSEAAAVRDRILNCPFTSSCSVLADSSTSGVAVSITTDLGALSASADATGGILRALSSYSLLSPPFGSGQLNGNAQFFDQLTISAPGLNGTTGYFVPTFAITGSLSGSAQGILAFFANASSGCGPNGPNFCQTIDLTGNSTVSFNPVAFTFGQPFFFEMDLAAVTYYGPLAGIAATSDFSHTAVLSGLNVFQNSDATNPVPTQTLSFTSADGRVSYSVNGIVPEPGSMLLLLTGCASFLVIGRRRGFRLGTGAK